MFKLLQFEFIGKDKRSYKINISNEEYSDSYEAIDLYTTLIIGNNGSGKSQSLRALVLIFRYLDHFKKGLKLRKEFGSFKVSYVYFGDEFEITCTKGILCTKNKEACDINQVTLPNRILAASFSVNDRFIFSNNDKEQEAYAYLGIRGSESGAGTKSFQKKLGESLVNMMNSSEKSSKLKKVLEFMGYKSVIKLRFKLRKISVFFKEDITFSEFKDYFINWRSRTNRSSEPFYYNNFLDIQKSETENEVYNLLKKLRDIKTKTNYIEIDFDFEKESKSDFKLIEEYETMQKLMALDILSSPEIELFKNKRVSLDNASSGEFHLLFNLINILSYVENGAIIFIDEPEISLHPDWQSKYVQNLLSILKGYSQVHVIIASHSHIMVSELPQENTSIVTIRNSGTEIIGEVFEKEVYGWNVDSILYNVFNTRSVRNYSIEKDIEFLLKNTSNMEKKEETLKILEKLNNLQLEKHDPLLVLMKKIEENLE